MVLARTANAALAVFCVFCLEGATAVAKTKIACVGASTTSGDGSTAGHHYPDELQRLVAPDGEAKNFGASGTTMLRNVSASYWNTPLLAQALAYLPDVTIIWFGGNDAKPENWTTHKGEFLGDYEAMIHMFQALPSHPRTYVVLSLLTRDTEGIPKAVVDDEVIPLVRQAAAETGSGVVDVHDALAAHPEYFPDGIHPNDMGTVAVAKLVYAVITAPPPDAGADAPGGDAFSAGSDAGAQETAPVGVAPEAGGPEAGGPGPSPDAASSADVAPSPDAGAAPDAATHGSAGSGGGVPATTSGHSSQGGGCAVAGRSGASPATLLCAFLFAVAVSRRRRSRSGGHP